MCITLPANQSTWCCAARDMLCLHLAPVAHKQSVLLYPSLAAGTVAMQYCQRCMSPSCPGQAGSGDWGRNVWPGVGQSVSSAFSLPTSEVCEACLGLLLAGCLYHSNVIVCRMHKHMQMTTACCSWRRQQRQR